MQCEEWADANSELFKEAHDETVHKNSYKRKLYKLISASLENELSPLAFPSPARVSVSVLYILAPLIILRAPTTTLAPEARQTSAP